MYTDTELNDFLEEENLWIRPPAGPPESQLARYQPRRQPPPENEERPGFALDVALRSYRRLLRESFAELGVHPAQESLLTEIYFAEGARTEGDFAAELAGRLEDADHQAFYRLLEALPDCVEQVLQARSAPAPPLQGADRGRLRAQPAPTDHSLVMMNSGWPLKLS